jgi:hypothetical protein
MKKINLIIIPTDLKSKTKKYVLKQLINFNIKNLNLSFNKYKSY